MLTSMRKGPRLALPLLSGMLLLSLSDGPSPAQASGLHASKRTPGHVAETITPTATVVSTAQYQATLVLTCNGGQICRGDFPVVGPRRRLNITRMSCVMRSAEYAAYASGQIELRAADGSGSLVQFLPADYSTTWGYHVLNRAIEVLVTAKQSISVALFLASGSGTAHLATCTTHGTLETLR